MANDRQGNEEKPAGGTATALPPVGTSVAILVAVVLAAGGAFAFFMSHRQPREGWIAFFVALAALWWLPGRLPGLREREALRSARKEARARLKSARQAMKKQKTWTGENVRQKLEDACTALDSAVRQGDTAAITGASQTLDDLADAHLARKPAWRESVEQIGGAVLVALFVRAFFYEPFRIPSPSMVPTLLVGDFLFVNKFVYGLRIPFTVKKVFTQVPGRGDIVVFNKPGDESGDDIIKRVIGLPGDRVEVSDRHVTICPGGTDCRPLETRPLELVRLNHDGDRDTVTDAGPFEAYQQYEEKVGRHTHVMQADPRVPQVPGYNEGSWTVEPGHVFVMGDNRDNSADSRFQPPEGMGQVPLAYLKGRADVIWLSLGGPYGVRFPRLFTALP